MRRNLVKQLFIISILPGVLSSCHPINKNTGNSVAVEQTVSCAANPAHAYEVFIPAHATTDRQLPLLVAIDPHGSGKTAVDHLKEAVTRYPAALVASNLIQNNDPNYMSELGELISDAKKRFPVGDRIYLVGFSGGARMVLGYASNHQVNGVIASGAFASPNQLAAIKCPVMGLIGMDDFNFLETVQYILSPESLPSNAHIELTNASHEWPEKTRLTSVFSWFQLSEEKGNRFDKQQVIRYIKGQQVRIDSLAGAGELLQAACISRNMASVSTFENIGSFRSTTNELVKQEAYKQKLSHLTESLRFEVHLRQIYSQALSEKNEVWWKKEISALHEKMASEPDEMTQMAYKRLGGFLGIVCYSYAGRFAAQKDIQHLEQILIVYRLAEPDNPDMKHFSEILEQLKKQR